MDNLGVISAYSRGQRIGLALGPLSYIFILLLFRPEGLSLEGVHVLGATVWLGWWWITDSAPMAATGLLPVVLFPLSGAMPIREATAAYAHPMIFLFLGGFILALAMEKWELHRRIALTILSMVGQHQRQIVLGFMGATGFLSMWISNTATTVMMMPIGAAVIGQVAGASSGGAPTSFGKALMLGIAYSASIGGMATLIGTPTNPIFASIAEEMFGAEISFVGWMSLGLPISVLLTGLAWWVLTQVAFKLTRPVPGGTNFKEQLQALGPITKEEKQVGVVFLFVALSWMTRSFTWEYLFPGINDTSIAIMGAVVLFLLPGKAGGGQRLMTWPDTQKLPWGILLLFGGGLCVAQGFTRTGLADWIGDQLSVLDVFSLFWIILLIVALVNFLTEVTSNVATASMILPILAALSAALGVHPYMLMVGATLAASCAFMLPVATAPNAVVFGSDQLRISDMVRAGFLLNLASIVLISMAMYFLLPLLWGLQ